MSKRVQLMKRRFLSTFIIVLFASMLFIPLINLMLTPLAKATPTFYAGFETGDISEFDHELGDQYVTSGDAHHGTYKMEVNSSNSRVYNDGLSYSELYSSVHVNAVAFSQDGYFVSNMFALAGSTSVFRIGFMADRLKVYYLNGSDETTLYNGEYYELNTWYMLKIYVKLGNGDGVISIYFDDFDTPLTTISNLDNDNYGNIDTISYGMGDDYGTPDSSWYIDCCAYSTTDIIEDPFSESAPEGETFFYSGFENGWDVWTVRTGSDNSIVSSGSIFNGSYVYRTEKDSYIRTDAFSNTSETEYLAVHMMFNGTFDNDKYEWFAQFGYNDENYINLGIFTVSSTHFHWAITRSNSSNIGISTAESATPLVWYNVTLGVTSGHPANATLWVDNVWVAGLNVPDDWSEPFDYALIGIYDADDTDLNFRYDDICVSSVRSTSWYRTSYVVFAESGSPEDLQSAVDAIVTHGGGTVYVPAGAFEFEPTEAMDDIGVSFVMPAGDVSIIGAGIGVTVLYLIENDSAPEKTMLKVVGGYENYRDIGGWVSGGKLRITGISFWGRPNWLTSPTNDFAILLVSCYDFRVDHCEIKWIGGTGIAVLDGEMQYTITGGDPARISQGVIDHNDIIDNHKAFGPGGNGYGIMISRAYSYDDTYWEDDIWNIFGTYGMNVFIEDNYFSYNRHSVTASSGGCYVFRHNVVMNGAGFEVALTGHPNRDYYNGMLGFEVYDNVFDWNGTGDSFKAIQVEGGSAVIFNNTISNVFYAYLIGSCELITPNHPTGHVKDCYIWDNDVSNTSSGVFYIWGNEPDGCPEPDEGVEYFLYAPSIETGYATYQYPHPLVGTMDLTVNSNPSGIDFTYDGNSYTTSQSFIDISGSHTVVVPSSFQVGASWYNFSVWEDATTELTRIVTVTETMTITATYAYFSPEGFVPLIEDFNDALDAGVWSQSSPGTGYINNDYGYANFTYLGATTPTAPNFIYTANEILYNDINILVDKVFYTNTGNDYGYVGMGTGSPWSGNMVYLEFTTGYSNAISLIALNSSGKYYLYNMGGHPNFAQIGMQFVSYNHSISIYENQKYLGNYPLDWFWTVYSTGNATLTLGGEYLGASSRSGICFDNLVTYYGTHSMVELNGFKYVPALTYFAFIMPEPYPTGAINKTWLYPAGLNVSTAIVQVEGFKVTRYQINQSETIINSIVPYTFYQVSDANYSISMIIELLSTHRLLNITAHGYGISTSPGYGIYAYLLDAAISITRSYVTVDPPGELATFDGWYVRFSNDTTVFIGSDVTINFDLDQNVTVETFCHLDNPDGSWFFRSANVAPTVPPMPPYGGYYFEELLDELVMRNNGTDNINYITLRGTYFYNITSGQLQISTIPTFNIIGEYPYREFNTAWQAVSWSGYCSSPEQLHLAVDLCHAHGFKVYIYLGYVTYGYTGDAPVLDYLDTAAVRAFLGDYAEYVVYPYATLFEEWGVDDMGLSIEMAEYDNPSDGISVEHPLGEPIITECNDLWTDIIMEVRDRFSGRITQQYTAGYSLADFNVWKSATYFNYLDYIMFDEWLALTVNSSVFTSLDIVEGWHNSFSGANLIELNKMIADYFNKKIVINTGYPNRFNAMLNPWSDYGIYGYDSMYLGLEFRHDLTQYRAWQGTIWAFQGQSWFGGVDFERYNNRYGNVTEDNYDTGTYPPIFFSASWRLNNSTQTMIFDELAGMILSEPPRPMVPPGHAVYLTILYSTHGYANLSVGVHAYYRGDVVMLLATSNDPSSWRWAYWFINAGTKRNTNPIMVTMTRNWTYTPVFASTAKSNVTNSLMSYLPYLLFIAGVGIAIILIRGKRE